MQTSGLAQLEANFRPCPIRCKILRNWNRFGDLIFHDAYFYVRSNILKYKIPTSLISNWNFTERRAQWIMWIRLTMAITNSCYSRPGNASLHYRNSTAHVHIISCIASRSISSSCSSTFITAFGWPSHMEAGNVHHSVWLTFTYGSSEH